MKERLYALIQIGKYIGVETMVSQVTDSERNELKKYMRRYFLNTHGMNQQAEGEAWKYRQEGTELGYKYLTPLYESLYN